MECAATLVNNLVASTSRVEEVRHVDIETDNLCCIVMEALGHQGSLYFIETENWYLKKPPPLILHLCFNDEVIIH